MKWHQMSLKSALGLVLHARPQVLPNPGFLQQLKEMEMELFGTVTVDVVL
jgi:atypical dual specificity phosphatase